MPSLEQPWLPLLLQGRPGSLHLQVMSIEGASRVERTDQSRYVLCGSFVHCLELKAYGTQSPMLGSKTFVAMTLLRFRKETGSRALVRAWTVGTQNGMSDRNRSWGFAEVWERLQEQVAECAHRFILIATTPLGMGFSRLCTRPFGSHHDGKHRSAKLIGNTQDMIFDYI